MKLFFEKLKLNQLKKLKNKYDDFDLLTNKINKVEDQISQQLILLLFFFLMLLIFKSINVSLIVPSVIIPLNIIILAKKGNNYELLCKVKEEIKKDKELYIRENKDIFKEEVLVKTAALVGVLNDTKKSALKNNEIDMNKIEDISLADLKRIKDNVLLYKLVEQKLEILDAEEIEEDKENKQNKKTNII